MAKPITNPIKLLNRIQKIAGQQELIIIIEQMKVFTLPNLFLSFCILQLFFSQDTTIYLQVLIFGFLPK